MKTFVINYKFRISEFAHKEVKKKALLEFRPQNTVVREIIEKWAKQNQNKRHKNSSLKGE